MIQNSGSRGWSAIRLLCVCMLAGCIASTARAATGQESVIVSLKEFVSTETRAQGFTLNNDATIHIYAKGGGYSGNDSWDDNDRMYAYGWILNAETREVVWEMKYSATKRDGQYRIADQYLPFKKGSYEAYFTNFGYYTDKFFSNIFMNIDRRRIDADETGKHTVKGWDKFLRLFGLEDEHWKEEWRENASNYGMEVYCASAAPCNVSMFNAPAPLKNEIISIRNITDSFHSENGFHLSKPTQVRIYAIGEGDAHERMYDYGWILEAESRKRVWDMSKTNTENAGGAKKNRKADEVITLPAGDYIVAYVTDDSHSPSDWNSAPPSDPLMYGITLCAVNDAQKNFFTPKVIKEQRTVLASLVRVRDDQTVNAGFLLKTDQNIRIYAIGERGGDENGMADYGWIVNATTGQRVWTMEEDKTLHAGGASKNRMIDEVVFFPKGSYIVYFTTDDSHAYGEWNDDPPTDAEHYGITVYGEGTPYNPTHGALTAPGATVLASIVQVGDDEYRTARFSLTKPTRVHILALGEGTGHSLDDYGWIEDTREGKVVWEMTYSMTTHAGGAQKNRRIETSLLLDKGEYKVCYKTDDSHAYGDWNAAPPDDPASWGITITRDEDR